MAEVVILNGPPGVGRSSVAAILRAFVPGTVAIAGDDVRAFAPADARAHLGGGATYRVSGILTSAFIALGAERVIFDYVFLRASHFAYFQNELPAATSLQKFTLWAPLEVVLARAGERENRRRHGPTPSDCYREMSENLPKMGEVIETAALTPEATARRIHELLANAAHR